MSYGKPSLHHRRLNRINRCVRNTDKKPHDQQAPYDACASGKYLTGEPAGECRGEHPHDARAGECHARPKPLAKYASGQLAQRITPDEGGINPAHLDFADAQLGHHEFARDVDVLSHQVRQEAE